MKTTVNNQPLLLSRIPCFPRFSIFSSLLPSFPSASSAISAVNNWSLRFLRRTFALAPIFNFQFSILNSQFLFHHTPRFSHSFLLPASLAILLPLTVGAQQPSAPHIGYVYPAGGRQDTTFQVRIGGQLLDGVTNAYVSGGGVQAVVVDFNKPLTPQQANALREKLKELQDKRQGRGQSSTNASSRNVWTDADTKMLAEIRQKLANFQRRPPNPAIAELATLRVTLAPDAEPGERELRVGARLGLSNPLIFCVGDLPEFRKPEPKPNAPPARFGPARNQNEPRSTPATETLITLPAVVNGQILPGGVDWFRFPARKGQHLVVAASARALIPYLADAVPGWFQAALTLCDAKGHELAYADHYLFHPDPVLYYEVPADGDYLVQIRDSIYRGREDFVYRIAIGELPFLASLFPLGGPTDSSTTLELSGWNLPTNRMPLPGVSAPVAPAPGAPAPASPKPREGGSSPATDSIYKLAGAGAGAPAILSASFTASSTLLVSVRDGTRSSTPLPFAQDDLPECLEKEPNNSRTTAQSVTLPIIINGRIGEPGDQDTFRFEGRAGEAFVAEVYARRLESPLDSALELTDAAGHRISFNDDYEDKGSGLNTHHADSYLRVTLPADGTYFVQLTDAQHQGGAEYAYRLRLSAPRPDFALRVVPSSITARAGASVPLTVYALRKDGFTNEIALRLKHAPNGIVLGGARLQANTDQVRLTLKAPAWPAKEPLSLSLEGSGFVDRRELVRPAVPADDMMQAFAYRHLVPARELKLAVLPNVRWMAGDMVKVLNPTPIRIPAGGTVRLRLRTPGPAFADRVHLELNEPPDGISLQKLTPSDGGAELVVQSDSAKAKPGLKGNLIINIYPERPAGAVPKGKAPANNRRFALGSLPAIPFEIVAQ